MPAGAELPAEANMESGSGGSLRRRSLRQASQFARSRTRTVRAHLPTAKVLVHFPVRRALVSTPRRGAKDRPPAPRRTSRLALQPHQRGPKETPLRPSHGNY